MRIKNIILSCTILFCAGCSNSLLSTTQSITPMEILPTGFASWTDAIPAYQLSPGDKIKVQFLLTPEMGDETVVGPDGIIGLRATGQLQAAGRTVGQLQEDISHAAAKTLMHPVVTVSFVENPQTQVFVGGAVGKPGAYTLLGRRGSFEAIQLAGGFSPEARMTEVVLIRRDSQNRPMLRTVDLRSLIDGSGGHPDVPLAPNDIVFVPRNRISEVDLWVDQFINKFLPFSRNFGYAVNRNPGLSAF